MNELYIFTCGDRAYTCMLTAADEEYLNEMGIDAKSSRPDSGPSPSEVAEIEFSKILLTFNKATEDDVRNFIINQGAIDVWANVHE